MSARSPPNDSASAVFPAADVAGEDEQRRPVGEQVQDGQVGGSVVLGGPGAQFPGRPAAALHGGACA